MKRHALHLVGHRLGIQEKVATGFRTFGNKRVSVGKKAFAISVGIALTALIIGLELPIELLASIFMPGLGEIASLLVDGLEILFLPVALASLILFQLSNVSAAPKSA